MIRRPQPPIPLTLAGLLLLLPLSTRAVVEPEHAAAPEAKSLVAEPASHAPDAHAPAAAHAAPAAEHPAAKSAVVEPARHAGAEVTEAAPPPKHLDEPAADRNSTAPTLPHGAAAATAEAAAATKHAEATAATKSHLNSEAASLLKLGASLTDRPDYDAAEIAFRQVLKSPLATPAETKSALLGLARMHRKQGALTKAVAIYERYVKDYPTDERVPDALLDLGRTLRSLGTYKLAITRFYNVINSTLKLPTAEGFDHYQLLAKTAQFEIAETHFQSGDYAEAGKFFSRLRLLDLAPADRARAHFKAAYAQRLNGDLEPAVATFRAFIAASPEDENVPEARYLLAVSLRELKHTQEAFQATLDLLHEEKSRVATDPKRWAYWQKRTGNQLANEFFESGDMLNAHAIYAGLAELSPEPGWRLPIVYQLALCYERLGIADRARSSYQSIVDGAGATPPADLAELSRMAAWRLENLAWHDKVTTQVSSFFETSTGKSTPPAASPASAAAATANHTTPAASVPTASTEVESLAKPAESTTPKPEAPPAENKAPAAAKTGAVAQTTSHP